MEKKDTPEEKQSTVDLTLKTNKILFSEVTTEKITFTTTSAFACAGASFAAVLILVQMSKLTIPLDLAVIAFSISLPLFIYIANLNELFLWLGRRSDDIYRDLHGTKLNLYTMVFAYGMFAAGFFAVLFHLSILAFVLSATISLVLIFATSRVTEHVFIALDKSTPDDSDE